MSFKNKVIILFGKIVFYFIKLFSFGSGSTWPGNLMLLINKYFIKDILKFNPNLKVILVTGTNGKTTTSALLTFLLKKIGYKVFNNVEGANLMNGIASSIVKHCNINGEIKFNITVFEVDENSFHLSLSQIYPHAVIILNLFRDQLDRYGETDIIVDKWQYALKKLSKKTKVYLNGDDPQIYHLGKGIKSKVKYFGLSNNFFNQKNIMHDVDSIYCPVCRRRLKYHGFSYSHLGDFYCKCGFKRQNTVTIPINKSLYSIEGVFSYYNITAVSLLLKDLYSVDLNKLHKYLSVFKPAFGRQEFVRYKDRIFYLYLSKNPVGLNQSINLALQKFNLRNKILWFLLNDRIPDGRDVSWIWDADIEKINKNYKKIFISGDRLYDMAVRFKYADISNINVSASLKKALSEIVRETKKDEKIIVFPTYTAMLDLRKILVGQKFV